MGHLNMISVNHRGECDSQSRNKASEHAGKSCFPHCSDGSVDELLLNLFLCFEKMTSKNIVTRKDAKCLVFGYPKDMDETVLPTYGDVMRNYLQVRNLLKQKSKKDPSFDDVFSELLPIIFKLWSKASIPVLSRKRVYDMLRNYHGKYRNILKSKGKKGSAAFDKKVESFKADSMKLFDIAACKCFPFDTCKCQKPFKVPAIEQQFLLDQRSNRKMRMGSVDKATTDKLMRRDMRLRRSEYRQKASELQTPVPGPSNEFDSTPSADEFDSGSDFSGPTQKKGTSKPNTANQMRVKLPSLASACDRTGVSDRAAATVASAVLQDLGLISDADRAKVIDRMKVRRERKRKRGTFDQNVEAGTTSATSTNSLEAAPIGLYFDGRKDKTITQEQKGTKYYRSEVNEEHYTLVLEPSSTFWGHVSPETSAASHIKDAIISFMNNRKVNTASIIAAGCDGTNTNTGSKGGVIALLEKEFKRPLQWLICLFHGNELPLRHLHKSLDGKTSGPTTYTGPIGKELDTCEKYPVFEGFVPIQHNLPEMHHIDDLSTDQKYLLEMCRSVADGQVSAELANKKPGKVSHSRWLTYASRILRFYVSCPEPSENLCILAEYVVKVYAPVWFHIKLRPSCAEGPRHLWRLIKLSRYLPQHLLAVIDPVIQRNGYFAHPENILLALLADERHEIRQQGLRRILEARTNKTQKVREFKVPPISFSADDYTNLISWQEVNITEPPLTMRLTDDQIRHCIQRISETGEMDSFVDFSKLPCHTQAVERMVKLVTDASAAVIVPNWTIEKCGSEDKVGVYDLLCRSFFKDEPLTCDLTEHPPMDELFAVKMLAQGHSYKAVLPSGRIVGVVINVNFADLPDFDDGPPTSGRIQQVVKFFEHMEKLSGLDETGLLELFIVAVDPDFRQQGMAKELGEASLSYAEDRGYRGLKIACTSKYSANMALALGFSLVFCLAYEDYKDDEGKPIFTPSDPHTHARILVKEFKPPA